MSLFRNRGVNAKVRDLIAGGVGVRQETWPIDDALSDRHQLSASVLEWVRECMSTMRRPNGVDQVALALSCRDDGGAQRCSASLGVLSPGDFYSDHAEDAISAFLDDVERLPAAADRREISGALVCLGDIAFALADERAV